MSGRLSNEIGTAGEDAVLKYLVNKGMKLVVRNWRCKAGELDLIMDDPADRCRVIVEVRLRESSNYGTGFETVDRKKQRKIIKATQWYQQQEDYWDDLRIDVVSVHVNADGEFEMEHVENAFFSH